MLFFLRISDDRRTVGILPCKCSLDRESRVVGQNVEVSRTTSARFVLVAIADIFRDVRSKSNLANDPAVLLGIKSAVEVEFMTCNRKIQGMNHFPKEPKTAR